MKTSKVTKRPHIPQDKEAKFRKYDSLAWLMQGDSPCGAACFDGEYLLIASNKTDDKTVKFAEEVKSFLYSLVDTADLNESSYTKLRDECNKIRDEFLNKIMRKGFFTPFDDTDELFEPASRPLIEENEQYRKAVIRSVKKITTTICHAYKKNPGIAYPREMIAAIRNKKIKFLEDNSTTIFKSLDLHAEMRILQKLFDNDKIPLKNNTPFYIGISKRCCKNCEHVIEAINQVAKDNKISICVPPVMVRDIGHKNSYRCRIPDFLKSKAKFNTEIKEKFLELSGKDRLEDAFNDNDLITDDLTHKNSSEYKSSDKRDGVSLDDEYYSLIRRAQKNKLTYFKASVKEELINDGWNIKEKDSKKHLENNFQRVKNNN